MSVNRKITVPTGRIVIASDYETAELARNIEVDSHPSSTSIRLPPVLIGNEALGWKLRYT